MAIVPRLLLNRLGPEHGAALSEAIDAIGEELDLVYKQTCSDHRESRGDNAQVFGLKIWARGEFRVDARFLDSPQANLVRENGSYRVAVSELAIGVYKLGQTVDDDIHLCFPDESPTKRAYAERNTAQLTLFEIPVVSALPADIRYSLNDLVIGHFGNPRDGLTKWYVGAMIVDDQGRPSWAWVERQDDPGEATSPAPQRPPIEPFGSREVPQIRVGPRQRPTGT